MSEPGSTEVTAHHDPDAPWRPGYTGPEPRPATTATTGGRDGPVAATGSLTPPDPWSRPTTPIAAPAGAVADGSTGECAGAPAAAAPPADDDAAGVGGQPPGSRRAIVGLTALALVFVVVAGIALIGGDGGDDARRLPSGADELWTVEVRDAAFVVVADGVVVVATPDAVVGLDQGTGTERWSHDVATSRLETLDGLALVESSDTRHQQTIALDPRSGEVVWTRDAPFGSGAFLVHFGGLVEVVGGRTMMVTPLDPRTGAPLAEPGEVNGRVHAGDGPFVPVTDGVRIGLLDVRTGERVGPTVGADPDLRWLTIVGSSVVGSLGETLVLYDDGGEIVDRLGLFAEWGPTSLDGGTEQIVVTSDNASIGLRVGDGKLDPVWSVEGALADAAATDAGQLAVIAARDRDGSLRVVDVASGEIVFESQSVANPFGGRGAVELLANGLVTSVRAGRLAAFDLQGEQMWEIDGTPGSHTVGDGVLVTLDGDRVTARG